MNLSIYIDAHVHLQDGRLNSDRAGLLQRAQEAGINQLLCNGTMPADWPLVLNLASRHSCIVPFIGMHPWQVDQASAGWLERLQKAASDHPCGIGEIGLDYAKEIDRTRQRQTFEAQLDLAVRLKRPVCLHCVKAWNPLIENLHKYQPSAFMVHAFNGSPQVGLQLIDLGGYLSFNALSFTQNRRAKTKLLLKSLPCDKILFETETPFGLNKAVPFIRLGAEYNEPANLPLIIKEAAGLIETDFNAYAKQVYDNSMRFIRPLKEM